ncbi:hypothetical protein N7492_006813 [Penicillium capsulatum]|uniref:Exonuclease domain-containing protein n=1 Tax=Penicillium capsulatum TaxID=69766 RepID=A0A9W9I150_9EURO|nr:hypothetical protein N7492_006813 [Penicillium capsulatum]
MPKYGVAPGVYTASRAVADIPPRIVHNPRRRTLWAMPIEQTEEYSADIHALELNTDEIIKLNYNRGTWSRKELKKKERCPRCRRPRHFRKFDLDLALPPEPEDTQERNIDAGGVERPLNEDTKMVIDDLMHIIPPSLEALPERIFLRPGKGVYFAKYMRHEDIPVDISWSSGAFWPSGHGAWPQPGVLDISRAGPHMDFSDDPTTNPWGIYLKPGPDGTMQHHDTSSKNFRYTYLSKIETSNPFNSDLAYVVSEMSDEEHFEFEEIWTCCNEPGEAPGCVKHRKHAPDAWSRYVLEKYWQMHHTPQSVRAPRDAVVLDCEMGINVRGDQELIRVTLLDYYTGEVLIDALVDPNMELLHTNLRWSGVSFAMLNRARAKGKCLRGRMDALERICDFVGPKTTLIMHGGQNDLAALRWSHDKIIDTAQLEYRRVGDSGLRSLKVLAQRFLHSEIQNEKNGHDSLQDAFATRDLCDWYVRFLPREAKKDKKSYPLCFDIPPWRESKEVKEQHRRAEAVLIRELCRIEL